MSKKFLVDIDLNKNQLLNVRLQNLATAPASPVSGQIYYNTTNSVINLWDGTQWLDVSGDIQSVTAGDGLVDDTGSTAKNPILKVNVDNASIEIVGDVVRIKDLGVTTAKINASAVTTAKIADDNVTTVKILDSNVTFAKIQDIATLTVIGRVASGSGVSSAITVITDLTSASSTTLATSSAIKTYVDNIVGGLGNLEGAFDASVASVFPTGATPGAGTKKGDYWYVTGAGTVNSVIFNIGDVLIAKIDSASASLATDWIVLESNRDQATTSVLGVARLATTGEAQALTNAEAVLTPASLAQVTATETRTGIAEIATDAELTTGTDDARIVTPLKLKTYLDNRTGGYTASVGNGANTTFALSHALNTKDIVVEVYENSTGETVITDVVRDTVNQVTVSFTTAPTSSQYRVVIKK
jgi:hypothetical protein